MTRIQFLGYTGRSPSIQALEGWPMYSEWLLDEWSIPWSSLMWELSYGTY